MAFWFSPQPPPLSPGSPFHLTPHPIFSCVSLVMSFSRDTLLEFSMTPMRLGGTKSLRDPSVSQLLREWVAQSPLAKACWARAAVGGYPSLIHGKQIVVVKPSVSLLLPMWDFIGLLMELNIPRQDAATSPSS